MKKIKLFETSTELIHLMDGRVIPSKGFVGYLDSYQYIEIDGDKIIFYGAIKAIEFPEIFGYRLESPQEYIENYPDDPLEAEIHWRNGNWTISWVEPS